MDFTIHASPKGLVPKLTADESKPLKDYRSIDVMFPVVATTELRIEHEGHSWSRETMNGNPADAHENISYRRIEILSPDSPSGLLVAFYERHKGDEDFELSLRQFVQVRARDFDLEELHKPDNRTCVYTSGASTDPHVQIDFLRRQFVVTGYRLHRFLLHPRGKPVEERGSELHGWSLRGSNNPETPVDEWTVLHHHHDEVPGDDQFFWAYPAVGGPHR
jgi:hypothetical protein